MSSAIPEHLAAYVLLAGFALALAAVGLGIWRLISQGLALRKRIESMRALPFLPMLDLTQARIAIASRSVESVPQLIERAQGARDAILASQQSLRDSFGIVRDDVGAFFRRA